MTMTDELLRLGGVATRSVLLGLVPRPELERALAAGEIVRLARGRYALPGAGEARKAAHALAGVLCLTSAAIEHGWGVKLPPDRPQVSVPRNRRVPASASRRVDLRRLRLTADDVRDGVTTPDRTLIDCLRELPFDEALTVADSALRSGYSPARLRALVRDARGPGSARMRMIAELATTEAANPFESCLRAIALGVPGLSVRPQVRLHGASSAVVGAGVFLGRPDLVDEHLRIVLEADSFEWHGHRAALRSDAQRYNQFVVHGWLVLRFCWEDVVFHPDQVKAVLRAAVAERTDQRCPTCRAAS